MSPDAWLGMDKIFNGLEHAVNLIKGEANFSWPELHLTIYFKEKLKGDYSIIFASNVFHNSHLIQKCIQNQQLLLILYTLLNQMRVVKNIRRKDDRITSL